MMIQTPFSRLPSTVLCLVIIAVALLFGVPVSPVLPRDQTNFEAYLGYTIDLHGVSYSGDQVSTSS